MYSKIILTLFFAVSLGSVFGQGFSYGVSVGLNRMAYHRVVKIKKDTRDPNSKINPNRPILTASVNALVKYRSSNRFGISFEPGWTVKGLASPSRIYQPYTPEASEFYRYLLYGSYLQIPILAEYYFNDNLNLSFGPEIGFLLKFKTQYIGTKAFPEFLPNDNVYNRPRVFDFGANLGLNYNFGTHFGVGLKYGRSFTPFVNFNYIDSNGEKSGWIVERIHYFQLNLNYKFQRKNRIE